MVKKPVMSVAHTLISPAAYRYRSLLPILPKLS
jgi:hypothetical protein